LFKQTKISGKERGCDEANYEFYSPLSRSFYCLIRVRTAIELVPN